MNLLKIKERYYKKFFNIYYTLYTIIYIYKYHVYIEILCRGIHPSNLVSHKLNIKTLYKVVTGGVLNMMMVVIYSRYHRSGYVRL